MPRSPFTYKNNNRLLRRQPSTSTSSRNPFIAGVDASDLWLSPPQASIDGQAERATSLPASKNIQQGLDFSLLGGDITTATTGTTSSTADFLLPSYSYSSPPSPGGGHHHHHHQSSSSGSAALFPSINSWIHSHNQGGLDIEEQEPIASTSYDPAPFYSPPSSAGALSSPSSSSASSTSPQLAAEATGSNNLLPLPSTARKKRRRSNSPSSTNMANVNTNNNPSVITTDSGAFNVNSKSGMKDACSYDLRDHQESAAVQKEYGGNAPENKDLNGLQAKVEDAAGPVCFPRTEATPAAPTSPSRFANPQDVKPHVGADPASSSLAASTNGSSDMGKPLSSSSSNSNNNNNTIALDPSLGQSMDSSSSSSHRPAPRAGQPSFLKNTGDGMIRTPGPGQMVSPKEAFLDYDDILKRSSNGGNNTNNARPQQQQQGSPRQLQQQQMQMGSPMQQQQFKLPPQPQQQQRGDIQVPQMNLPQMPAPQQPIQNSFQAQPQQPPPPGQYGDATEAQLLAALGGQRSLSHQGSPQNNGRGLPNQQQQQQRGGAYQMGSNQGSPQQRQLQTQPAPQPMTVQQQNQARQAAYQGFMAHPPPTGVPNTSTDIQVPQSNAPTTNVGTPSAGQSSLPPLPNYQSAPAPLSFNDGSFFSHQALLASLQAEEHAKAAAAAAAVMGFQNGNWTGGQQGQQQGGQGQQQQNGNNYNNNFAQPGQQGQQQGGLPPFAPPAPGGSSVLGDFSFEQHFGPPPPAGNSPDASTSSRKRIKGGKSGSRGGLSRSNSTTSNNGGGRNKAMAAEARALGGNGAPYGGAFNFGAYGNNNVGVPGTGNEFDAEGEDDDESKPQFNSRGMPKRKSASAARELAQAQQKDHGEEYEYQGFIPKGSGVAGGSVPPSANLGAAGIGGGGGGGAGDDSDDSDDDDGDEWVAEESDDSYGRKKKAGNKRGRKSGTGKASLTPAEAEALRAASPTTAAAALASVNANGTFDFSGLLGDYSVGSPDSTSGTPGPAVKKRKSNAAPPGSGNISCDYVDPKTGERCPVKFRRPYDQARHMETVHSGQAEKAKWACITCKKSFSRKDALIRHGRISSHPTM